VQKSWQSIKGYVMSGLAFISCPCHLPITLPLLVIATAGTAFSAWLQNNFLVIGGASTVIFVGSLVLALRWSGKRGRVPPKRLARHRNRQRTREVVLVTSRKCESCGVASDLWADLGTSHRFRFEKVDIHSKIGRSLAAKYNILRTPTTLIDGSVAFDGVPDRDQAILAVAR